MRFEASPLGQASWSDREDLSIEFTRLLASAQEGGATVAECLRAASRIDFLDDDSWHAEWMRIADNNRERGDAALRAGNVLTANSNWLRAIGYYQAAAFPFDRCDGQYQAAIGNMRGCASSYVRHRDPPGEVISIPWPGFYPLEAHLLPPCNGPGPRPLVICIGEPGKPKEEYLFKTARYANQRGMSLLAVDLLGTGPDTQFDEVVGSSDLERAIGHIMDYLVERPDVDRTRIAILADGWGSSFVARGIAFDDRFAAAVCDGGLWDLHERAFLMGRASFETEFLRRSLSRVARNIKCPVLISTGERAWLTPDRVRELYDHLKAGGRDVTLKIFEDVETAAMQGHADNPTLANEYIFDWIASRLGISGC
jgi:dienelactone hydrolase